MTVRIVERPAVKVAYLRYTGPLGEPLNRYWRNTVSAWLAEHGLVDCPRYGITIDDPASTPPEKCRYDACVQLPPGMSVPDAAEQVISGGRYAVTNFKGTGAQIGAAWGDFMGQALSTRGCEVDGSRAPFEHYPRGAVVDARTGVFACELCLPVGKAQEEHV